MSQDHTPGAIYLTEEDVVRLLPMTDAIEAVELAFRHLGTGGAVNRPRERIAFRGGLFHFMAGADQNRATWVTKPTAASAALGRHDGHALQHRERARAGDDGGESAGPNSHRRGQRSGNAAPGAGGPAVVGQLGTGYQGVTQLAAVASVRGDRRSAGLQPQRRAPGTVCGGDGSTVGAGTCRRWQLRRTRSAALTLSTSSPTAPRRYSVERGCHRARISTLPAVLMISHREIDVETVRRATWW